MVINRRARKARREKILWFNSAHPAISAVNIRRLLQIIFLTLLVVILISCQSASNKKAEEQIAIDYSGIEPQVAKKIRDLQHQAQENPKDAAAWGKLGMTLDVHGFNDQSINCYKKAAELQPQDFQWAYYCAIALKEAGSNEALTWFQKGIKLRPDYVPQQIRYARALFDAGKLNESENRFQEALRLDRNSGEAYVGLAQIAMYRNDVKIATKFAGKAIQSNPKQSEAYSLLAILYRRSDDTERAEQALAKFHQLPEKTALTDPVYSALVSEGESAFWYRTRGRTYMDSGLYLMAMREFKKALELHEDAEAYDNLGVALQGLGRLDEAIVYHKKAISLNPDYLKFYNLGIAYAKSGQLPDAMKALENSIQLKPDYSEAYYNLGVAYYKLSNWQKASENLKKAVQNNPNHIKAHHALTLTFLAMNDEKSAMNELTILRKLDPSVAASIKIN
ncbi:MAG TPA: tetratricopeptide repeat protein [Acidobacteriota bacterium]|nr:tetratricopeptide repeat protein [Acidobacteriota bacterium]